MKYLTIKNWEKFQHYKDRNPPWIKLATDTFQNYEFSCLQDASKLLAICSWTLAARSSDYKIPYDLDYIKRQCGLGNSVNQSHLKELIDKGFLEDASEVLAGCKQDAIPETEGEAYREEEETEKKNIKKEKSKWVSLEVMPEDFASEAKRLLNGTLSHAEVFDGFQDHWLGNAETKADWLAVWRNWCRRAKQYQQKGGNYAKPKRFEEQDYRAGTDGFIVD